MMQVATILGEVSAERAHPAPFLEVAEFVDITCSNGEQRSSSTELTDQNKSI